MTQALIVVDAQNEFSAEGKRPVPNHVSALAAIADPDYINRWRQWFEAERLAGLRAKYRGQPPSVRTPTKSMDMMEFRRTRGDQGTEE